MAHRIFSFFIPAVIVLVFLTAGESRARSFDRSEMNSELESLEPGTGTELNEETIRSLITSRTELKHREIISIRWQMSSVSDPHMLEILALIVFAGTNNQKQDEIWLIRNDITGWDLVRRLALDRGITSFQTVDVDNDGHAEIFYTTQSGTPFCSRSTGKLVNLANTVMYSNSGFECRSRSEDGVMGLERETHEPFFFDVDNDKKLEILDRIETLKDNSTGVRYMVYYLSQGRFIPGNFRRIGKDR
jgi:hypothetical protein